MENTIFSYTDEERRLLKRNTKFNIAIIRVGFNICIFASVAAAFLLWFRIVMHPIVMIITYLIMYLLLIGGGTCSMLGIRSFRKENGYFRAAFILETISVFLTALTAAWVYLVLRYGLQGIRYNLFAYFLLSLCQAIAMLVMSKGYRRLLREQEKLYIRNHFNVLAALFVAIAFFVLMIIVTLEIYCIVVFGVAIIICCLVANYQIRSILEDVEGENITIYCLSVKGTDWAIGAAVMVAGMALVCFLTWGLSPF